MITFLALAIITGGALSWFASTHPDGLEGSIEKVTGKGEFAKQKHGITPVLKDIQEKTAFLPDYNFKPAEKEAKKGEAPPTWPGIRAGTSVADVVGAVIVLGMIVLIGMGIGSFKGKQA